MTFWNQFSLNQPLLFICSFSFICSTCPVLFSCMAYHHGSYQSNTTDVTSGGETAYPSRSPEFTTSNFSEVRVFRVVFCRSVFVPFVSVFFWQLLAILSWFTDCSFGIFKLFLLLRQYDYIKYNLKLLLFMIGCNPLDWLNVICYFS